MDDPNLLVGTETSDDAGVYQLSEELAIINTTDYFTPIVDDPYDYGAIAATNSLSDVYSMGGIPKTALNITCWPKDQLDLGILHDVLRGGADKVKQAKAVSLGGHTVTSQELMYGLAVTGVVHPDRIVRNFGAKPGDALILTKRLGVGILTTGLKFNKISETVLPEIVESMARLNASASEVMQQHNVHACTDITGFGLLGHGFEMAQGNGVRLEFFAEKIPVFDGASTTGQEEDLYPRLRRQHQVLGWGCGVRSGGFRGDAPCVAGSRNLGRIAICGAGIRGVRSSGGIAWARLPGSRRGGTGRRIGESRDARFCLESALVFNTGFDHDQTVFL